MQLEAAASEGAAGGLRGLEAGVLCVERRKDCRRASAFTMAANASERRGGMPGAGSWAAKLVVALAGQSFVPVCQPPRLALCLPVDATYQCHARGFRQPAMEKGMAWRGPTSTAVGASTPRSYLVYTAYPNVLARAPHRSACPSRHVAPPTPHNHQPNGCLLSGERRRCRWAGADP